MEEIKSGLKPHFKKCVHTMASGKQARNFKLESAFESFAVWVRIGFPNWCNTVDTYHLELA